MAMSHSNDAREGGSPARRFAAGGARGGWGGLGNWRLRSKLALILLIPTLTALTLGTLRALDELERANELNQTADEVAVARESTAVVHELQRERVLAVAVIAATGGNGAAVGDRQAALDAQVAQTDQAVDDLRAAVRDLDTGERAARVRYERGLQRLSALAPLRSAINNSPYPDVAALGSYNGIVEALIQLVREVNTSVSDRALVREATTVQAVVEAKEFESRVNAALRIAALRDVFPGDLLDRARDAQAAGSAALNTFRANATLGQQQLYSDTVSGPTIDDRALLVTQAFDRSASGVPAGINVDRLTRDSSTLLDKLRTVQNRLLNDLLGQTRSLAESATFAAWRDAGIVLTALAAALGLMLVIARQMLRPLRLLGSNALEVAHTRLPEAVRAIQDDPDPVSASKNAVDPVPVNTTEEIGELARSFDAVHEQAVQLAAEQALLRENVNGIFVNISRRSQRLVERQLGMIDRLESDEQDPDQLASLFELDHLATRLRRNGESLLVLSGAGLSKSLSKPVPAADVLGASVSEIEQYSRVEVGSIPQVAVRGSTVHDLVHLLAELFDNATYFSEPETKVSVRAVVTRRKALAIQITDRGVGMTESQIAEANERLADPPDLDVSVTRRMGLYVVARLAQRHGIEVRLRENEDIEGGVIARVVVPRELLDEISTAESSLTPLPNNRPEEQSQPWPMEQSHPAGQSVTGPATRAEPAPPAPVATGSAEPEWPREETSLPGSPAEVPTYAPAGTQPQSEDGLTPLAQPLSLDDLVAGTSAAGPFVDPTDEPEPSQSALPAAGEHPPNTAGRADAGARAGNGASAGAWDAATAEFASAPAGRGSPEQAGTPQPMSVPRAQPRNLPAAGEQPAASPAGSATDEAALEDEVPTKRLPIYQSVLSRWFSEESPADLEGGGAASGSHDQSQGVPVADNWESASDSGWNAAESLLHTGEEEVTHAGLPKRVPNAYLVPGSVQSEVGSASPGFTDTTSAYPSEGAMGRSAESARSRMMNFQRGYTRGRHALSYDAADEHDAAAVGATATGERTTENGVRE